MFTVDVSVDMSGFQEAFELANQFTKRTPAEACNVAGYYIAAAAQRATPFVELQTIDSELAVEMLPVMGKRGKPLKNKKTYRGKPGGLSVVQGVPFSVLIIQARSNPNSRYNALTEGRYALMQSPFKGLSRAAGRAAMAEAEDRMIKGRHSSPHFIAAGWVPARKILAFARRYGAASGVDTVLDALTQTAMSASGSLGFAIAAIEGNLDAFCFIENDVGMGGGPNESNYNKALWEYGLEPLQMAVDVEGIKQMNYYLKKTGADFRYEWNRLCGA